MRQLTDSEKKMVEKGWLEYLGNRRQRLVDFDFYEAGFIAGLDYQQAKLESAEAEYQRVKAELEAKIDTLWLELVYAGLVPLSGDEAEALQ